MPMPESCDRCLLNYDFCYCHGLKEDDPHYKEWGSDDFDYTTRPDYCPLKAEHDMPCFNCPMQPIRPTYRDNKVYCGQCGKRIPLKINAYYCHKCGREIDWQP